MAENKYISLGKLSKYHEKEVERVDSLIATAKSEVNAYAESLAENYDSAGSAATVQGKLDEEVLRAKAAEEAAQAAADKAQSDVDALDERVGPLPEGTAATSVVDYVNLKTAGIATDAALGELNNQVSGLQTLVNTINGDYLKEADKTELADAIADEADRAKGVESGLETRLKAVEDDYLVAADKTELQGNINTVSGKVDTLIGEDTGKSARTIANEELAKQLIADNAKESMNELQEIAAWIQQHPEDAAAMNKAIGDLEALVGTLPEGISATTIVGYIQEAVAAEKARAEGIEAGLAERLTKVEGKVGESASIATDISTAKQEAIDAAAADATSKANTAEANAKGHADELNTAMNSRVEALEAIDHDHANKAELDLIAIGDKAKWDAAAAKAHEHANADVLDGITAEKVAAWDSAEADAIAHADGLNTTMSGRMDAVEAWQANMVECTDADIEGLFA